MRGKRFVSQPGQLLGCDYHTLRLGMEELDDGTAMRMSGIRPSFRDISVNIKLTNFGEGRRFENYNLFVTYRLCQQSGSVNY